MAISTEFRDNLKRWQDWEARVNNMNAFSIPDNYSSYAAKGKYDRFTGFLKEWAFSLFESVNEGSDSPSKAERDFSDLDFNFNFDDEEINEWWKNAIDAGNGKKTENNLPKIDGASAKDKQVVYEMFLPAYRAIKERFDKRSVFEWIFNHSQYIAERDSLKALEGIVSTLTGDGVKGLKTALSEYQKRMPTSDTDKAIENEETRIALEKSASVESKVENKEVEKEVDKQPVEIQDLIDNNDHPELNNIEKESEQVVDTEPEVSYQKPTKSSDFLKIGYIPDAEDLTREWELIKPLYDAVNNDEIFSEMTVENITAKEVLFDNYLRLKLIKDAFANEGAKQAKQERR